jgi:hypothetical protein
MLLLAGQFQLTTSDVRNILIAGFKSAFLTFHDRAQLIRRATEEIDHTIAEVAGRAPEGQRAAPQARAAARTARS